MVKDSTRVWNLQTENVTITCHFVKKSIPKVTERIMAPVCRRKPVHPPYQFLEWLRPVVELLFAEYTEQSKWFREGTSPYILTIQTFFVLQFFQIASNSGQRLNNQR